MTTTRRTTTMSTKKYIKDLTSGPVMFHLFVAKVEDVPLTWAGHEDEFLTVGDSRRWDNWLAWLYYFGVTPEILTHNKAHNKEGD